MDGFTQNDADQAPVRMAGERMAGEVYAFSMAVTESLCLFDKEGRSAMERPENHRRRAQILADLGELDRLMGDLRNSIADLAALRLPLAADGREPDVAGEQSVLP